VGTTTVVRPTALAPSLPPLRQRVIEMMQEDDNMAAKLASGEAKIPSLSALATRMCPTHAGYSTSMRMLARLQIKWAVQCGTARKLNPDFHYNNAQSVLLREDLLIDSQAANQLDVLFISADDKAKVNVGNPGLPRRPSLAISAF
jgi:hypothetical protein